MSKTNLASKLATSLASHGRIIHTGSAAGAAIPAAATSAVPGGTADKDAVAGSNFLAHTKYVPRDKKQEREFFRDFKYKITRPDLSKVSDPRFSNVLDRESQKPLVMVFGWAGANSKNLGKYADVYHAAGCDTLAYYLPTRFIFYRTEDVPYLAVELLRGLEREGLLDRPVFWHLLSDTGIMAHQGIRSVMRDDGVELDTRGAVMDSCPGPIPKATFLRVSALLAVHWYCAVRDQMGLRGSTLEVMETAKRVWPNYLRRLRGLPAEVSYVDGVWSGDFLRADRSSPWPELFLYSRRDFYLPWRHLEEAVLPERRAAGRDARAVCFGGGSGHVSHLRGDGRGYRRAVWDFLDRAYFRGLREGGGT